MVTNVLDEVPAALSSSSIVSKEFSWIRYITDWAQSGAPFFFAVIKIEKRDIGPIMPLNVLAHDKLLFTLIQSITGFLYM